MNAARRQVGNVEVPVAPTAAALSEETRESHVATTRFPRIRTEAFGNTHVGLVREGNEDSFAVLHHLGLFMVADGMGGAAAGEVASRMVLDGVREAFESVDMTWPAAAGERPAGGSSNASVLVAGLQRANTHILNISRRYEDKRGMGTTFAGLLAQHDRLVIAHVGDSRVYRMRGRRLDLLTEDHSLLNELIRAGRWDPARAHEFPKRNIITRAVGAEDDLEVETRLDAPRLDDVYLICSDGLHGMVHDRQIEDVLLRHRDLTLAVERLIELGNDNGGEDNITAVLVRVTGVGKP